MKPVYYSIIFLISFSVGCGKASQIIQNKSFKNSSEEAICKPRFATVATQKTPLKEEEFDLYFNQSNGIYVLTEAEATIISTSPNFQTRSKNIYFAITTENLNADGTVKYSVLCNDDLYDSLTVNGAAPNKISAKDKRVLGTFGFKDKNYSVMKPTADEYLPSINLPLEAGAKAYVYSIDQRSFEFRIQIDREENGSTMSLQVRYVYRFMDARSPSTGPESITGIRIGHPGRP